MADGAPDDIDMGHEEELEASPDEGELLDGEECSSTGEPISMNERGAPSEPDGVTLGSTDDQGGLGDVDKLATGAVSVDRIAEINKHAPDGKSSPICVDRNL